MYGFITSVLRETVSMFLDAAPYMTLGILISGLLKAFIDPSWVQRYLGGKGLSPVFKASIAGIPLPLCSCGVIPAAAALKKQGASSGATVSFLISTPQSGVDSIALSYALLDPVMTVARPIVAFISAFVAGGLSVFFGGPEAETTGESGCCSGQCHDHDHGHDHSHGDRQNDSHKRTLGERIREGFSFAVVDIWGDLSKMFFVGILLSGLISVAIPQSFLEKALGGGLSSMLLMTVVGIPMYICATSSTPLAATLILKGVSPGAALVFLMAGPATSIINLPLLHRILGTRRLAIYLGSIVSVAVTAGLVVDHIYGAYGLSAQAIVGQGSEHLPQWVHIAGAVALLSMWGYNWAKDRSKKGGKMAFSCNRG
nr:SO_0444 family Cu/Zn efflux transporter [uncultured Dethiosulfovibrio sp.]